MTTVTSRARPASARWAAPRSSGSGQVRVPSGTTRQTRLPSRSAPASDSSTNPVTWSGASRSPAPPMRAAPEALSPSASTCPGRWVVVVMSDAVLPRAAAADGRPPHGPVEVPTTGRRTRARGVADDRHRAQRRVRAMTAGAGSALDVLLRGQQPQLVRPRQPLPVTGDGDRERAGDGGRGQPVTDTPAEEAGGEVAGDER